MNFITFRDLVNHQLKSLIKSNTKHLFIAYLTKEELWDTYLNAFPEENRQEHNCNACKSYIRQYGGLVSLTNDLEYRTMWDFETDDPVYGNVVTAMRNLVNSATISSAFLSKESSVGLKSNRQLVEGQAIVWNHFHFEFPSGLVYSDAHQVLGKSIEAKAQLHLAFNTLTVDALETVLELIEDNNLYRGESHKKKLENFLKLKREYDSFEHTWQKVRFVWKHCWNGRLPSSVTGLRNTSIGTLLVNLSENMPVEIALRKYEDIVAPHNYQRPKAVITPSMLKKAKSTLEDLGVYDSIHRRSLVWSELSVSNSLFVDRSAPVTDIFDGLAEDIVVNPKQYDKLPEITATSFTQEIIPQARKIEILFESRLANNLVALLTAQKDSPTLFSWDNTVSWCYRSGVADSIKERVKRAGGKVEGVIRCSLGWHNTDDLDLHVITPSGLEIYYANKYDHLTKGNLDVDMNANGPCVRDAVENIVFPSRNALVPGVYKVFVVNYNCREYGTDGEFSVEVAVDDEVKVFEFSEQLRHKGKQDVCLIDVTKSGKISIRGEKLTFKPTSKQVWGIGTNKFHTVQTICYSPNYWGNNRSGNKHLFFLIESAKDFEPINGLFNEFLREEFKPHKRVFETLCLKNKVIPNPHQVSGLGFSSTLRNHFICRVDGKVVKVKI